MPDISKINALAIGSVSKVDGLAKASILDIDGVAVPDDGVPAAAYSVRLLGSAVGVSSYTGPAMRIRRSGDDIEADVEFDSNNEISLTSPISNASSGTYTDLADFVDHSTTPRDAFVDEWKDQSGSGNHATQSTLTSQPKLYDATTGLITENGKPAIDFVNDFLDLSNFITPSTVSDYSVTGVCRPDVNDRGILILSSGAENMTWHYGRTAGNLSVGTYDGTSVSYASGAATIANQFLGFSTHDFTTPQSALFINGNSTSGTAAGRGDFDSRIAGGPGGRNLNGVLQEIIIWPVDQTSNRTGIETDINGYFSIYT